MSSLEALAFFRGLDLSIMHIIFNCVDVVLGSAPSAMSSTPCPTNKFRPSSPYVVVAPVACATATLLVALSFSVATFLSSQVALTSMANCSLCLCWANLFICSLVASFCFCVAILSYSAIFGVRHSRGHDSSMMKMASSIALKGSLVQFYTGSLRGLIYTLCMSTLKSTKLHRLLYTSTQKILVS